MYIGIRLSQRLDVFLSISLIPHSLLRQHQPQPLQSQPQTMNRPLQIGSHHGSFHQNINLQSPIQAPIHFRGTRLREMTQTL